MKKSKKILSTLVLSGVLITANLVQVQAVGTERKFWDMTIFANQSWNRLVTRNKETYNTYSRVKLTGMSSVDSVRCQIAMPLYSRPEANYTYYYTIKPNYRFNQWVIMNNLSDNKWVKGDPVYLKAVNTYKTKTVGKISGIVDYE